MASPQVEKGFTRIANELMSALSRSKLNGIEYDIVLTVIAKTYGWNKKKDRISLSQFSEITQQNRSNCARAIKNLVRRNILGSVKGDTQNATTYYIQKDYDKWITNKGSVNMTLVSKTGKSQCQPDTRGSVNTDTRGSVKPIIITKDNLKDTIKDTKTGESVLLTEREKQDVFAEVFSKYPNKDGSKEAWAAFRKDVNTVKDAMDIKKALDNYLITREVKNGYIKSGEKWFGRWRDFINNAASDQDPLAKWRTEKR